MEALLDDSRICKITGMAEEINEAKDLILKAMQGVDIVQRANLAAIMVILVKHFEKMGFEFPGIDEMDDTRGLLGSVYKSGDRQPMDTPQSPHQLPQMDTGQRRGLQ